MGSQIIRQVRRNLGKFGGIWAKMVLEVCFDLKKCAQHDKKCSRFFWRSFSLEFFSGTFREIWAKILRTPKNTPAPPMPHDFQQLQIVYLLLPHQEQAKTEM